MKKIVTLFFTSLLFLNTAFSSEPVTNFYIKSFDGLNWLRQTNEEDVEANYKVGYVGSLALGYRPNLEMLTSVELEIAGRKNDLNYLIARGFGVVPVKGHVESLSLFVNSYYELFTCSVFTPYVGVGLGYTWLHATFHDDFFQVQGNSDGISGQFIGGVKTSITDNVELGLEYRYFLARQHFREQNLGLALTVIF